MNYNLFEKELKNSNLDYVTDYSLPKISLDIIYIDKEPGGTNCVYMLLDLNRKHKHKFWLYDLDYELIYIGVGSLFEKYSIKKQKCRMPINYVNTMFNELISTHPDRFKIVLVQDGLTLDESIYLQAYLINYALDKCFYKKCKSGNLDLAEKQILNKKRVRLDYKIKSKGILNTKFFYGDSFK